MISSHKCISLIAVVNLNYIMFVAPPDIETSAQEPTITKSDWEHQSGMILCVFDMDVT